MVYVEVSPLKEGVETPQKERVAIYIEMNRCKIVQSNRVLDQNTTKYPVNEENDLAQKDFLKLFHIPAPSSIWR